MNPIITINFAKSVLQINYYYDSLQDLMKESLALDIAVTNITVSYFVVVVVVAVDKISSFCYFLISQF